MGFLDKLFSNTAAPFSNGEIVKHKEYYSLGDIKVTRCTLHAGGKWLVWGVYNCSAYDGPREGPFDSKLIERKDTGGKTV